MSSCYSTYTYVHKKKNPLFRYSLKIKEYPIDNNYRYLNTVNKIVYAIKNYPERKSFYFDTFEDIKVIANKVVHDLGNEAILDDKIYWNEFAIKYKGEYYEISRCVSSNLYWKTFEIKKI